MIPHDHTLSTKASTTIPGGLPTAERSVLKFIADHILDHGYPPSSLSLHDFHSHADAYALLKDDEETFELRRRLNGAMMSAGLKYGMRAYITMCGEDAVMAHASTMEPPPESPHVAIQSYSDWLIHRYQDPGVIDKPAALAVHNPPVTTRPTPGVPEYLLVGNDCVVRTEEPCGIMRAAPDWSGPMLLEWWAFEPEDEDEDMLLIRCAREMWDQLLRSRTVTIEQPTPEQPELAIS